MTKKYKLSFLQELTREFHNWHWIIKDILYDIKMSRRKKVVYNIDFSYLFEYIWDKAPVGIPPFIPGGRKLFTTFIENNDKLTDFKLVFTGPSYYELLDSIKHKIDEVKNYIFSYDSFYNRLKQELENNDNLEDIDSVFINSGVSSNILDYLPNIENELQINRSFNKIQNLFKDNKTLNAIGDFIDPEIFKDKKDIFVSNFRKLLGDMMRHPRKSETRDVANMEFHYAVDTSNIITTMTGNVFEDRHQILFVTQDYLRRTYLQKEGRSPYVPYFRVTAKLLEEKKIINNSEDYFHDLDNKLYSIKRDLSKVDNKDSISANTLDEIVNFFESHYGNLCNLKKSKNESAKHSIESLKRVLKNKNKITSRLDGAKEQLESTAKRLIDSYRVIVEKDPVVEIIAENTEHKVMEDIRKDFLRASKNL